MKRRLWLSLALCLLLSGCAAPARSAASASVSAMPPDPASVSAASVSAASTSADAEPTPADGPRVYTDTSKLTPYVPAQEIAPRRQAQTVTELTPGDYGTLRPYIGTAALSDSGFFGEGTSRFAGAWGLLDGEGRIAVDPVYAEITPLYDREKWTPSGFYRLCKGSYTQADDMVQTQELCGCTNASGSFCLPCEYEAISLQDGCVLAVRDWENGLMEVYDSEGNRLADTSGWAVRPRADFWDGMDGFSVTGGCRIAAMRYNDSGEPVTTFYDFSGNVAGGPYTGMDPAGEAPFGYQEDGLWGFAGEDGTNLASPQYTRLSLFSGGYAVAQDREGCCLIDETGAVLARQSGATYGFMDGEYVLWYNESGFVACTGLDGTPAMPEGLQKIEMAPELGALLGTDQYGELYYVKGDQRTRLPGFSGTDIYPWGDWTDGEGRIFLGCGGQIWVLAPDGTLLWQSSAEELGSDALGVLEDNLTGGRTLVSCDYGSYPTENRVAADAPDAPQLGNVELLGVYGGWYLVQDEFTAGYLDAAGNWLFRVNLMQSLAD